MTNIILASGSPQRKELISHMGIEFICVPSAFVEYLDDSRPAEEVARELALGKALEVAKRYPGAVVIGSDTIPTLNGRQLGKSPDVNAARRLLLELSGQTEEIYTAVAVVCQETGVQNVRVAKGSVVFEEYGDKVIETFLASGDWQEKAAATAVQSNVTPPISYITGDYDTILGMSTALLVKMLAKHGIKATAYRPNHPFNQKQVVLGEKVRFNSANG